MVLKPVERRLLNPANLDAQIKMCDGVAHTIMCDGRIIAIMGFIRKMPGTIVVFVVPSVYVEQYKRQFYVHVKRSFHGLGAVVKPLHRMESMAYDSPDIDRWMTALGFTCEGTHKNWSEHKDTFKTWARYIDE